VPLREIIGKATAFGLVSLACIGGGFFAFYGSRQYNDYVSIYLPWFLWIVGVGIGGLGALLVLGIVADAKRKQREDSLHITPRPGPLGPPPPWGMGDVGRPGSGVVKMGEHPWPAGGGMVRVVTARASSLDAFLLVGIALVWTLGMLIWLAPR